MQTAVVLACTVFILKTGNGTKPKQDIWCWESDVGKVGSCFTIALKTLILAVDGWKMGDLLHYSMDKIDMIRMILKTKHWRPDVELSVSLL